MQVQQNLLVLRLAKQQRNPLLRLALKLWLFPH